MSLETQVQNLADEVERRWKALRGRGDDATRQATRDLLAKLALGTWLLADNLLRAAIGRRIQRQSLGIRRFQQRLGAVDEPHLIAMLSSAVDSVLWHLVVARRDGIHRRQVERLIAEFVDAAETDLTKLNRMAKG